MHGSCWNKSGLFTYLSIKGDSWAMLEVCSLPSAILVPTVYITGYCFHHHPNTNLFMPGRLPQKYRARWAADTSLASIITGLHWNPSKAEKKRHKSERKMLFRQKFNYHLTSQHSWYWDKSLYCWKNNLGSGENQLQKCPFTSLFKNWFKSQTKPSLYRTYCKMKSKRWEL